MWGATSELELTKAKHGICLLPDGKVGLNNKATEEKAGSWPGFAGSEFQHPNITSSCYPAQSLLLKRGPPKCLFPNKGAGLTGV